MSSLVVFDFCGTLCKYETAGDFIDFVLRSHKKSKIFKILLSIFANRYAINFMSIYFKKLNYSKKVKIFLLNGITKTDLEELGRQYFEKCKNDLNISIVQLLEKHIDKGDHVIIVSGGLELYLRYFKDHLNINFVIGTKLKYINQVCSGLIYGRDCMYGEKVKKLKNYLLANGLKFDDIVSYSDSINDLSLLKFSNKAFVISNKKPQEWACVYGFNEIII
jgi:HAD superfamily hydrolase (TIGR01490 family)